MKALYNITIVLLFIVGARSLHAQNYACYGDTVTILKPSVRGDYFWQKSTNGIDWSRIAEPNQDTLVLIPTSTTSYRLEIMEGECLPIYSSAIRIDYTPIPAMSIPLVNKVCQNSDPFKLQDGNPTGGKFIGSAIKNDYFDPQLASVGSNQYYYLYQDAASGCKDSIFGVLDVMPVASLAQASDDLTLVITDSVVISATNPEVGIGNWRIISGQGIIKDSTEAQTVLFRGDTYGIVLLEWSVKDPCGSSKDQLSVQFVEASKNPCEGMPFVFDRDNNRYKTIQIGNQCWMAENLKVGKVVQSTLQSRAHSNASNNNEFEVYAYDNNLDSLNLYGGLYDWDELMNYSEEKGSQGVCPDGWHVPTREEWEILNDTFPEQDAGSQLQATGTSGFDAYMSGDRHANGGFVSFGSSTFFWTSSSWNYDGQTAAYYIEMVSCNDNLQRGGRFNKKTGASVRCLRNE